MQVRLGECVEAFEEPQVVEELECAGVDGVAAEVPQVVSDVLTVLGVPFGTSTMSPFRVGYHHTVP